MTADTPAIPAEVLDDAVEKACCVSLDANSIETLGSIDDPEARYLTKDFARDIIAAALPGVVAAAKADGMSDGWDEALDHVSWQLTKDQLLDARYRNPYRKESE